MKTKIALLTASLFGIFVATQAFAESCPSVTKGDLTKLSQNKKIISEESNWIEAVDQNAAENITKALNGMGERTFKPKNKISEKHGFLDNVCVYELNSNEIKEAWIKVAPIVCPDLITRDNVQNLLKGNKVFPQWEFTENNFLPSSKGHLNDQNYFIVYDRSIKTSGKMQCHYAVVPGSRQTEAQHSYFKGSAPVSAKFTLELK